MGPSTDRPDPRPDAGPGPVQNLIAVPVADDTSKKMVAFPEDGTADVTIYGKQPGTVHFLPRVPVTNPTGQVHTRTSVRKSAIDAPASTSRILVEYPYHQRGSIKHWDRGTPKHRAAHPSEYNIPLGARLDVDGEKTVWIDVHADVDPREPFAELASRFQPEADAEFEKRRPGHFILAQLS